MEITDDIFQSFYAEEKIIDSDIKWTRVGEAYITNHVPIITEAITEYDVNLVCKVTKYNNWAFTIYYSKNKQILVKYDTIKHPPNQRDKHTNKKMNEPHKHKFKEGCRRNLTAKIIPEEEIDRRDVNKAIGQFFEECNIRLEGNYTALILSQHGHIQTQLYEYNKTIFDHRKRGGE